jgi:hypothetical protein
MSFGRQNPIWLCHLFDKQKFWDDNKANNRRYDNGNPTAKTTRETNKRVRVIRPSKGLPCCGCVSFVELLCFLIVSYKSDLYFLSCCVCCRITSGHHYCFDCCVNTFSIVFPLIIVLQGTHSKGRGKFKDWRRDSSTCTTNCTKQLRFDYDAVTRKRSDR